MLRNKPTPPPESSISSEDAVDPKPSQSAPIAAITSQQAFPAEYAASYFRKQTGETATHLVFAPGRVNLIGEHTDYNGGFVLPMAIEPGIFVAARKRDDSMAVIWSEQYYEPLEIDLSAPIEKGTPTWGNYVRGVLAGLQEAGLDVPGFEAVLYANLPAGGGLSSSSALEVSIATLGESLTGTKLDPVKKALLCQKAEHEFAGTPCGIMDQFAIVFGQQGNFLLIDCQSQERTLVPMLDNSVSIVVINTMVKHQLTDGGYANRRAACFEAAKLMGVKELRDATMEQLENSRSDFKERVYRRARHVITEDQRTLAATEALRAGKWEELGKLMYASHESLRADFEVSCGELDLVVEIARRIGVEGGVYGCRMTGGGFGGCCVALVDTARADAIATAIHAEYMAATNLNATIFSSRPAGGATVLTEPAK
jgi:galactokinase